MGGLWEGAKLVRVPTVATAMASVTPAEVDASPAAQPEDDGQGAGEVEAHKLPDTARPRKSTSAKEIMAEATRRVSSATKQVVRLAGHPLHVLLDAKSFMSYTLATVVQFWSGTLAIALVVAWGGLVFAHLETQHTNASQSQYVSFMAQLQGQLNSTAAGNGLYSELLGNYVADPTTLTNPWLWGSFRVFLFSFELITTIGYGECAPKTLGGRLCLCLYSFICIPVTGLALTAISSVLLSNLELCIMLADPLPRKVWRQAHEYDGEEASTARKSSVSVVHVRAALERQTLTAYEVEDFEGHLAAAEISRHYGAEQRLTYWQFLRLFSSFESDNSVTGARHRRRRLAVALFTVFLWLMMGMFSFNHYEGWGYVPSLYFSFVTLATIGLGDFYPDTRKGVAFLFFFSVTGIGLVAVLLSCVADVWQHLNSSTVEVVAATKKLTPSGSMASEDASQKQVADADEVAPIVAAPATVSILPMESPDTGDQTTWLSMRITLPDANAQVLDASLNALLKACIACGLVVHGASVNAPVSASIEGAATEVTLQVATTSMSVTQEHTQLAKQMTELLALRKGSIHKATRQRSGQKGMQGAKFARVGNR